MDIKHSYKALPGHPTNQHCGHIAGQPFMVSPPAPGRPQGIVGVQSICCWCGPSHVKYIGIAEEGHGPFVSYEAGSPIIVAQG